VILGIAAWCAAGVQYLCHHAANQSRMDAAGAAARIDAQQARERIESITGRVSDVVDALAAKPLWGKHPAEEDVVRELHSILYDDPGYLEIGVAYAPFEYDPQLRLYGVGCRVDDGVLRTVDLDERQDYTNPSAAWYRMPTGWQEPVAEEANRRTYVRYTAPIRSAGRPLGILYATYDVARCTEVFDTLDLGENGFAFVASPLGHVFAHPNAGQLHPETTAGPVAQWPELASAIRDPVLRSLALRNPETGSSARAFLEHVGHSGWTLGLVLADRDSCAGPVAAGVNWVLITLLAGFGSCFVFLPLVLRWNAGLWILSAMVSGVCVLSFSTILYLRGSMPTEPLPGETRITRHYDLNRFLVEQRRQSLREKQTIPQFIPTGLLVQSLVFVSANEIQVTGYVWQRYSDGIHDGIERGFLMPQSESLEIKEAYRSRTGDSELIGWNFKAVLRVAFDYSTYPFGPERLALQLWHKEFHRNVILVPYLDAYQETNATSRPGLSTSTSISGWEVVRSYFNYKSMSYDTSFGQSNSTGLTDFPELFYTLELRKQILSPFVSHMLPLIVVSFLLFALLCLCTHELDSKRVAEFSMRAIGACAGFFLVVVFSHIDLRKDLASRGLSYVEFYYFVTYGMIVYVVLSFLFFAKTRAGLLHYRENLVSKLLFWPLSQATVLILTIERFLG